jgi:hypothetical protein
MELHEIHGIVTSSLTGELSIGVHAGQDIVGKDPRENPSHRRPRFSSLRHP